jgi:hypothetical protein
LEEREALLMCTAIDASFGILIPVFALFLQDEKRSIAAATAVSNGVHFI